MKKILVTGANGFLGSRFINYYKDKYIIKGLKRTDLDLTDETKTIDFIAEFKPDYILHTAAMADTLLCEQNPNESYKINVIGATNIAKAASRLCSRLIFLSTEQVYNGNTIEGPFDEAQAMPNTIYGKHKLEAENKILKILDEVWILRLTWLFGLPERNLKVNSNIVWNVVSNCIKSRSINEPINEYRGMTYVYDLIQKMEDVFEIPYGIYNIGSTNNLNRYQTAISVLECIGIEDSEIIKMDNEKFSDKKRDIRFKTDKLERQGIVFCSTAEGIKKCIDEFGYNFNL